MTRATLAWYSILLWAGSVSGCGPRPVEGGPQSDAEPAKEEHATPTADQAGLEAGIRAAVFDDRKQLLALLADPSSRQAVCTPVPLPSYEQFQAFVRDRLETLWDLDIYRAKYQLTDSEHSAVLACTALLDGYLEDYDAWQKLVQGTP